MNSKITWELPHNVPFEAKEALIKKCIDRWRHPSLSCFLAVFTSMSDFVESLLKEHFGRFKQLERHIRYNYRYTVTRRDTNIAARISTRTELNNHKERGSQAIENALELEQFPLFEGDTGDFDSARNQWLAHYKDQRYTNTRRTFEERSQYNTAHQKVLSALSNIGYTGLTIDDVMQRLVPTDEFEDELIVMAEVSAYFQVAHKVSARPRQFFN
jgi:vacuolar protein sorting-associated protein 1